MIFFTIPWFWVALAIIAAFAVPYYLWSEFCDFLNDEGWKIQLVLFVIVVIYAIKTIKKQWKEIEELRVQHGYSNEERMRWWIFYVAMIIGFNTHAFIFMPCAISMTFQSLRDDIVANKNISEINSNFKKNSITILVFSLIFSLIVGTILIIFT